MPANETLSMCTGTGCVSGAQGEVPAAHTPTPWAMVWGGEYIVPAHHALRAIGAAENDQKDRDHYAQIIATMWEDRHGRGDRANAALIVRAVNAHADLVAALREAREYVRTHPVSSEHERVLRAINAALEKATRA